MIDSLILKLVEFLIIRYEGEIGAELRAVIAKGKEAKLLALHNKSPAKTPLGEYFLLLLPGNLK